MIKYASNAFLATKITYINELANLCEKTGVDIKDISVGMGSDQRIGRQIFKSWTCLWRFMFSKRYQGIN